jgi:molybdenum cofactor biosynthesis protein MoaC
MIDTSSKFETLRQAKAEAHVKMTENTVEAVKEKKVPKGDVLEIARAAAVMAAKKTAELIPFCHPIPIDFVGIEYELKKDEIIIRSEIKAIWKTGVEMEALLAVSMAALTVYDMLKPLDQEMVLENITLLEKKGGKSDFKNKFQKHLKAAVLVISDSTFEGKREDKSGKIIKKKLMDFPVDTKVYKILPDNTEVISLELKRLSDEEKLDIIFTTGGTGLGPKDLTPEATLEVIDRTAPGVIEAVRNFGQKRTPYAMLSRNICGVRGNTLIINLPGSSRGAEESMSILFPGILHAMKMIRGGGHNNPKKTS